MNKKRMMQIIASISLIGGLTGAGKTFAYDDVESTKVEIGLKDEELIEKSVNEINTLFGKSWILPQLKITNEGDITVGKHWARTAGVGEKDKKVGENWEMDEIELKNWWINDAKQLIDNYLTINKYNPFSFFVRKTNISLVGKFYNNMTKLKEKGLFEKAIARFVETRWDEQLEKFQEQIEKKRAEVESKQLDS